MTSIMGWVTYDSRRVSAFHLISDSRITWGSEHYRWDAGRKVFACSSSPDLFGYCGDVAFPAFSLGQITEAINAGLLFGTSFTPQERHDAVFERLKSSFKLMHNTANRSFSIFHVARSGEKKTASFSAWKISFNPRDGWNDLVLNIPEETALIFSDGSGANAIKRSHSIWERTEVGRTSRSVFSAFVDVLSEKDDPLSGGPPQLVSLYAIGAGRTSGILYEGECYLHGLPVGKIYGQSKLDWFDHLFQRVNPLTKKLLTGAQRQPRPNKVRKKL